jgi:hypothetical protein
MSYGLGEVVREAVGWRRRPAPEKVDRSPAVPASKASGADGWAAALLTPGCAFGAVVDERLKDLTAKADEIRGRVNALIFTVLGAIVVELLLKLSRG